jgi:hypothetical protein
MTAAEKASLTTSHQQAADTMMQAGILGVGKSIDTFLGPIINQMIGVESANNPKAKNTLSSATGLGQFIKSTWNSMIDRYHPEYSHLSPTEKAALRTDPALSREMTLNYAKENVQKLSKAGINITPSTVYGAHFLGPAGAIAAFRADPKTPAVDVLGSTVVNANPNIMKGSGIGWRRCPSNNANDGGYRHTRTNGCSLVARSWANCPRQCRRCSRGAGARPQ